MYLVFTFPSQHFDFGLAGSVTSRPLRAVSLNTSLNTRFWYYKLLRYRFTVTPTTDATAGTGTTPKMIQFKAGYIDLLPPRA